MVLSGKLELAGCTPFFFLRFFLKKTFGVFVACVYRPNAIPVAKAVVPC